jgi:hypothetical protein
VTQHQAAAPNGRSGPGAIVLVALILVAAVANLNLTVEDIAYWRVRLAYALVGAGVGFAGTPASHSLRGRCR